MVNSSGSAVIPRFPLAAASFAKHGERDAAAWRARRCARPSPPVPHSTEADPCAMHHAARRGQLTLTLEWDLDSRTAPLWANHVRVKWWGEPGDGRLLWCASAAPPHRSNRLRTTLHCRPCARRPAHGDDGDDSATLRYDIACGPQQLAKYLADMRMLVLNLEQAGGEGEGGERPCYPVLDLPCSLPCSLPLPATAPAPAPAPAPSHTLPPGPAAEVYVSTQVYIRSATRTST